MYNEDVSLSGERVAPRRGNRCDRYILYRREVIVKPLYVTLLACKEDRSAVHAGATRIGSRVKFAASLFTIINSGWLHIIGLGRS